MSNHPKGQGVSVRGNDVEQALRVLKKKLQKEGDFREMKLKQHFEKPSEKKARQKAAAIARDFKLRAAKLAKEEGITKPEAKKILRSRKSGRSPR